jgi:hypothetical protein
MIALAELRPTLLPALRLSGKAILGFAGACLTAIVIGLVAFMFPHHDPNECKYGEPPHIENADTPNLPPPVIARPLSPSAADIINRCPGGLSYNTGDFKLH